MSRCRKFSVFGFVLYAATAFMGFAADYERQTLEQAHEMFHAATNSTMYADAAHQFEFLVKEEGVRNGHLFYTLGNCWFMAGDLGHAILNYRRAEQYLPRDADLRHNLSLALEQRADLIPEQNHSALIRIILGWHYKTSSATRWWLFAVSWSLFWMCWFWHMKTGAREAVLVRSVAGALSLVLISSLIVETILRQRTEEGVILSAEVVARKGDGMMYAPTFLEPLHAGTEFVRIEQRNPWWCIRLADGQECWIPSTDAEIIEY